jgi:hypothetical protein
MKIKCLLQAIFIANLHPKIFKNALKYYKYMLLIIMTQDAVCCGCVTATFPLQTFNFFPRILYANLSSVKKL